MEGQFVICKQFFSFLKLELFFKNRKKHFFDFFSNNVDLNFIGTYRYSQRINLRIFGQLFSFHFDFHFRLGFTSEVKLWYIQFSKAGDFQQVTKTLEIKGHKAGVLSFSFTNDSKR